MEKEKERKIRDLTGNQEERIAPKSPERDRGSRPQMKRPQVRMADGSQPAKDGKNGAESREDGTVHAKRRFDRGEKRKGGDRNRGDRKQEASAVRDQKAERSEAEGAELSARAEHPQEGRPAQNAQNAQGRRSRNDRRARNEKRRNDPRQDDARREENNAPKQEDGKREDRQKPQGRRSEHSGQNDRGDRGVSNARRKRDAAAETSSELFRRTDAAPEPPELTFTDEELLADGLLFMLDEPEPAAANKEEAPNEAGAPNGEQEQFEVVGIRFRGAGKVYYFSPNGIIFSEGDHAVLETVRGMEYGEVAHGNTMVNASEIVQPLKPVLRKATAEDDERYLANLEKEQKARPIFEEKVSKNHLEMQLVDVEYTFDNTKLCFYFTAEGRVDFRELVKDLASVFRTRIELRQIGVRDEARMFGGLGVCGRPFCCKSFLSDFVQVSIKMAKEQNLSLASAKISGSCGRLMCCLRYEQDTYERENALLPRPNSIVSTPKGRATVLESNFLTGNVKVLLAEENVVRVFSTAEVKLLEPPRAKGDHARGRNDADAAAVAAAEETAGEDLPQEDA